MHSGLTAGREGAAFGSCVRKEGEVGTFSGWCSWCRCWRGRSRPGSGPRVDTVGAALGTRVPWATFVKE